jgi:hypothetical protein
MMKRSIFLCAALTAVLCWTAGNALALSGGPDPDLVNRPGGFGTCAGCHGSGAPALNHPNLTLAGLTKRFNSNPDFKQRLVLGQYYVMTLTHAETGGRRFGFELGAFDAETASMDAGELVRSDLTKTQLDTSTGLTFLKHTLSGSCRTSGLCPCSTTATTACSGSQNWGFEWLAPEDVRAVTFYVCSNAADNDCCASVGDKIRCTAWTALADGLPELAVEMADPEESSSGTLNYSYPSGGTTGTVIAANGTTNFTMNVMESFTVNDIVSAAVNMTPPTRSLGGDNLNVTLRHPDGSTFVTLYNGARTGWTNGTKGPFAAFDGKASNGFWTLRVVHSGGSGGSGSGSLGSWSAAIGYTTPPTPGGVRLTWPDMGLVGSFSVWSHIRPDFDDDSVQPPVLLTQSASSGFVAPDCEDPENPGQPTCYYLVE